MKFPRLTIGLLVCSSLNASAQPQSSASSPHAAIEKTGDQKYRIGAVQIDTAKREVVVPARINDVVNVEFVATGRLGIKAYESLLSLNTDAVPFNAALLLIGLDPSRSRPSRMQFDPVPPSGDAVELLIEFNGDSRRIPVEDLLYDQGLKQSLTPGPWVYSGSAFVPGSNGKVYLAEMDGVLVGMMHGPSAIIDTPRNDFTTRFGYIVPNPKLAKPGAVVSFIIRAVPAARPKV